ncbi:MAG: CHAT domain-containing protein, partial [Gammaproteobacteria bacterium]|nr:CHAT domain-containing protein [Gammaproteobacteria bacterium]
MKNYIKALTRLLETAWFRCVFPYNCLFPALLALTASVSAEVVSDGTLGRKGPLSGPDFKIESNLGQQEGGNLFHSFASFDLAHDETATFSGPDAVENVINRVTGGEASHIDGGLISVIPDANLYFINPAGVTFGPNAYLDVQGSLHVSSADYLRLGNFGRFDAFHPEASVLTAAPPAAFGFLQETPAEISERSGSLAVPNGKTLSFVGGNLSIEGEGTTFMAAPEGRINLVSVASPGEVPADMETMADAAFARFGKIKIVDTTEGMDNFNREKGSIDVSGAGGGRIFIRGGKVILDNSYVFADTRGEKNGQGIEIEVEDELELHTGAIVSAEGVTGSGDAGNITVQAGSVILNQAAIFSTSKTPGKPGNIHVTARDKVELSGYFFKSSGGLSTTTNNTVSGDNGGDIVVETPLLIVADGAEIRADTRGSSNAGDITVRVDRLRVESGGQLRVNADSSNSRDNKGNAGILNITARETVLISGYDEHWRSALLGNTFTAGEGGSIVIKAPLVEVKDRGIIEAGTKNHGKGGTVSLEVEILRVHNDAEISTKSLWNGDAGRISINARQLSLYQGGIIKSTTAQTGNGGQITIDTDTIMIRDAGSSLSTGTNGAGPGGTINLTAAQEVRLADNAAIASSAEASGDGGAVNVTASALALQDSDITTQAQMSGGGDITLAIGDRFHARNAQVITQAGGDDPKHHAGNIRIENPKFILLDNGKLFAGADKGHGGDIAIKADYLVRTPDSRIDATSKRSIDGNVYIHASEQDVSGDLLSLPANFLKSAALQKRCAERRGMGDGSSFTVLKQETPLTSPYDPFTHVPLDAPSGTIQENKGQFARALQQWETALRLHALETHQRIDTLLHMAPAYQASGKSRYAKKSLEEAEELARQAGDNVRLALVLSGFSNLRIQEQHFEQAKKDAEEAVKRAYQAGVPSILAAAYNTLGNVLASQKNENESALTYYRKARNLAQRASDAVLNAKILTNIARLQTTRTTLDSAFTKTRTLPDSHDKAFILIALGDLARQDASQTSSYAAFTEALRIANKLTDAHAAAYAVAHLGELANPIRNEEIERLFREAIFYVEQAKAPDILYRWQWGWGRLYKAQQNIGKAIAKYRKAVRHLQSIQAVFEKNRHGKSFRETSGAVYLELADLYLRQAKSASTDKHRQEALHEARNTLEHLKNAELTNYFKDECVTVLQDRTKSIDKLITGHTAAFYPIVFEHRHPVLLVSFPGGEIKQFDVQASSNELRIKAKKFRNLIEKRGKTGSDNYDIRNILKHAEYLYKHLIEPIETELELRAIDTLVIVADDILRAIPFAALHNGEYFLINKFALAVTPGLALTVRKATRSRDSMRVLLNGLSEGVQGFRKLPHVLDELKEIAAIYDNVSLLDDRYLKSNLEIEFKHSDYQIVLFATHAQFESDPNRSFILTHDGKLMPNDLEKLISMSRFGKEPLEILVLSACETAKGDYKAALGLSGIGLKAGAGSVVGSLWKVSDKSTARLIPEFFRNLKDSQNIVSKAKALQ